MLKKVIGHFTTITRHKILVMKECFKIGLYKQGLTHDLSKYSPTEFLVGCKYYQGNRSPNEIERREKGYSAAWLHHKGRNKHHLEYWIDYAADGSGMCGGCRLTVDGKMKFTCVDGPEFDGHLVDFDEAIARSKIYEAQEQKVFERRHHYCNLQAMADAEEAAREKEEK